MILIDQILQIREEYDLINDTIERDRQKIWLLIPKNKKKKKKKKSQTLTAAHSREYFY